MSNKLYKCLIFAIAIPFAVNAQVNQKGYVLEYNEELAKTPLSEVEIVVRGSGQRVSKKDGSFELRFRTERPGDPVIVNRIEKIGYEVFNKEAIEQWNISPMKPFNIVMCNSKRFKSIRDNYERVSSLSFARQQEKEKQILDTKLHKGLLKAEEYQEKLEQLQDEFDMRMEEARPYIERFARIDLSELNNQEREIIKLIRKGNIDEGIELYKKLNLEEAFEKNRNLKRELDISKDSILSMIDRKNEALMMQGGIDNLKMVEESYKKVADADTTYLYGLSAYASFLSLRHRAEESLKYRHMMISCGKREHHKWLSSIYGEVGATYRELGNIEKAKDYYNLSLEANEKYNKNDTIQYLYNMFYLCQEFSFLCDNTANYSQEEELLENKCFLSTKLKSLAPDRYKEIVYQSYQDLVQFYLHHNREKVDDLINKIQELEREDINGDDDDKALYKILNLIVQAQYMEFKKDFYTSDSLYKECVNIIEPYYYKDEQRFNLMYANILLGHANLCKNSNNSQDAIISYKKALQIFYDARRQNIYKVTQGIVICQCMLGEILLGQKQIYDADSLYRVAYRNIKRIENLNTMDVLASKMICLNGLAEVNIAKKDYDTAETYLEMFIQAIERIEAEATEYDYLYGTWDCYYNLGQIKFLKKKFDEAESCILYCATHTDEFVTADEKKNTEYLLLKLYELNKKYREGIEYIDILLDSETDETERITLLHEKGCFLLMMGEKKEAKKIWNEIKESNVDWKNKDSLLLKTFK